MTRVLHVLAAALIGACMSLSALALTPVFAPMTTIATGTLSGSVVIADFDDDGNPDIMAINFTTTSVYLGNGDGTFRQIAAPAVSANASLGVAADFNGDEKIDVIITNFAGSNLFVLIGNGDGTFQAPVSVPSGLHPIALESRDLNGDEKLDLIVSNNGADSVSVFIGNGDGTFAAAVTYPVGRDARALTVGDFDGDGNDDIAVANFLDNKVAVLLGNGDGTFGAATYVTVGAGPQAVTHADFDGDGIADLVVTNNGGNTISVLIGNGDGTFASAVSYTVGSKPRYAAIADFDGDGKLDLAVTSNEQNYVSILSGNGDGTFAAAVNFATGSTPNDVKVADVDRDGRPDLVVANFVGASASIFINKTPPCVLLRGCPDHVEGTVIEFYNPDLDNYFITAETTEQLAIYNGAAGPGWELTGGSFRSGGTSLVCRFYGSLSPGPNSHFYTIDPAECQALKDLQATTPATQKRWNFESNDFASTIPVGGQCAAGTVPVYRAYNDGFTKGIDSNHRITSNFGAHQGQIGKGWKDEGIVMCAPQ